jgi:FKBP-type peptidyl-prolyl cis-trans isomerase SlyD
MIISRNRVVSIGYTLYDEEGAILDSSTPEEPLSYIHGTGSLVEGLETALEGKEPPAHVSALVAPAQAYGMRDDSVVFTLPRAQVQGVGEIEVGMQLEMQGDGATYTVTVTAMDENEVTLDGNHPLAGLTLRFEVDVMDVREATPDELEHGHVHDGPSGHSH